MNRLAETTAESLWRWRYLFATSCLIVTLFAATKLTSLSVSNSLDIWYPQDAVELVKVTPAAGHCNALCVSVGVWGGAGSLSRRVCGGSAE